MNTYFGLFGIIFFALGLLLHSKEKKRHFNRRNSAGIERFTSYEDASWQRFLDFRVCQVFCVSFKKIFWGGEPPHLYHPTLLNDTLLKCFGNISNRVSCQ